MGWRGKARDASLKAVAHGRICPSVGGFLQSLRAHKEVNIFLSGAGRFPRFFNKS